MAVQIIDWRQPGRNHDPDKESLETATDLSGVESVTVQSFGPGTEIDNIMKRFYATGEMPQARKLAEYGDFDDAMDLQSMLEQVKVGERAFFQIPANIRGRFDNDPGRFIEWIHDEANHDEAVELGLLPRVDRAAPAADDGRGTLAAPAAGEPARGG